MTQYEKYNKSNVNWLPKIPAHWEMGKAKYYFQYTTGFTPPTGVVEFYNGDITWVTIADMNQKVVSDSATKLSQTAIDKYNPDLTLKDSLLYSFKLSVGKVAYAGKDLYTNEAIISILPNEKYDLRYFYYTLPEQLLQNASENIYGAKMLNQELIRNASICFPPKDEQTDIANYLDEKTDQIDTLIANKRKLIALLKEERTAIIEKAVKYGVNKNNQLMESKLEWFASIPTGWAKTAIKYIAKKSKDSIVDGPFGSSVNVDTDYVTEGIPVVRTINITDKGFSEDDLRYMRTEKFDELKRHAVYPGDILFSKVGTIGNSCIFPNHIPKGILSTTGSCKITVNPESIINKYLVYLLRAMKEYFHLLASSNVQPFLNMSTIRNVRIAVPPIEEQKQIIEFIEDRSIEFDLTISKIEKETELLNEYRAALISEVVKGKIKVA
jgi:type I restriction enzyme S subunit